MDDYVAFPYSAYERTANIINKRIKRRKAKGVVVPSDQVWTWIKEINPGWKELDWEKAYRLVKQ